MVDECATALGRRARIVPLPAGATVAAASVLARAGLLPAKNMAMLRRFLEDRSFDISPAEAALGFAPHAFADGLQIALARFKNLRAI